MGSLPSHGTGGAYMMRGNVRGRSPSAEHAHQYWYLSPHVPSWKLYQNPSFTDKGQLVPAYIPRYRNAPLHHSANSFTSSEAQLHAANDIAPTSHHGLTMVAPNFAIKAPDAPFPQHNALPPSPHLLLSREKCTSGSFVSARKLAASFWERYGVHKLEPADGQHSPHAEAPQPCLQPPSNPPAASLSSIPPKFQVPEALENRTENCGTAGEPSEKNMASSPAAMLSNVLHRMRSVEETQSRSMALLSKLTLDMEDVTSRIQELEFSHESALREINSLLQRFGEQMAIHRRKEQEKARLAFMRLRADMEEEREACRVIKLQNKKLSKDLTHANIATADACEELDKERKARELLEEVCNELAREIGEDKAEVEQLKQKQAESRERLEEELRMMRMAAAAWRGERVWSKLSEVDLELDDGKEGMPLHELRSKLQAFIGCSKRGSNCGGSEEEIAKQAEQVKLDLSQALELLELEEESKERQNNAKDVGMLASSPCANVCFTDEKASSNTEHGDGGNHFQGDSVIVDGLDSRFSSKKPRKPRRRLRASAQQRHSLGMRSEVKVYDQSKPSFWETHCANSAWSASSDDELDRGQLTMSQSPLQGHVFNGHGVHHVCASSVNLELDSMLLANGHVRHTIQKMRSSVMGRSSEHTMKKEACHLEEQNISNANIGEGSSRRKHSSARFEVSDTGPSMHYSFSEDDVASYTGRHGEQGSKQQGILHAQSMHNSETMQMEDAGSNLFSKGQYVHQHHDDLDIDNRKSTSRGDADSMLDEFYFQPVRGPSIASDAKLNHKANGKEDGIHTEVHLERGFNNCGGNAYCQVMAKPSQACKDLKDKVHECAESSRTHASQEVSNVEGSNTFGGKEAMNKASPWRISVSASKPLPRFWPPSPDAFSIFGGAKKQSKAGGSSTPPPSTNNEQKVNRGSHSCTHTRHPSPAKEASYQLTASEEEEHVCVKSNSLGAQLIKAREHDKPAKPSFRFSPLRRAMSHG